MVSVIVPNYNHASYLVERIESILNQTYQDFELILLDGCSTDKPFEVIEPFLRDDNRIKFFHRDIDNGLDNSRNFGIQNSQGDYILLLDADDKISSIYIEKAIYHLENNPSTKLVYGEAEYFGAMHGKWELPDYDYNILLYRNHIYIEKLITST